MVRYNGNSTITTIHDGLDGSVLIGPTKGTKRIETVSISDNPGKAFSGFVKRLKKTNECGRCKNILDVARNWNNKAHKYKIFGPNSNSAAGLLLRETGFGTWRPPGALGWDDLFDFYPPYRIGTNQPDYVEETTMSIFE